METSVLRPQGQVAEALWFFQELWPDGLPANAQLIAFRPPERICRHTDLAAAARSFETPALSYFGICAVRLGAKGRGRHEDVVAIPGLVMDIDTLVGKHSKSKLPSHEAALPFIHGLPIPPTLILDSGGGYYALWLFREAWFLEDDAERMRALNVSRAFQALVIALAAVHGWDLDDTSPLTQMLRPAGALNSKYDPPRLVRVVASSGLRYNPSDFEELVELYSALGGPQATAAAQVELPTELAPSLRIAIDCLGGVLETVRTQDKRLRAIVLQLCPVCGGRRTTSRGVDSGTAHIAPISGKLRCKRQSCPARESGPGGGLSFVEWTRRFLTSEAAEEVQAMHAAELSAMRAAVDGAAQHPALRRVELAEADAGATRAAIEASEEEARESRAIVLHSTPTGTGKTTAVIDLLAERCAGVFFARNHALLDEIEPRLRARDVPVVRVVGVHKACKFQEALRVYGYPPDWRGTACRDCPHRNDGSCEAWSWQDKVGRGVILAATDALPSLAEFKTDDDSTPLFAEQVVFVDEAWTPTETIVLTRAQVRAPLDFPCTDDGLRRCLVELLTDLERLSTAALALERQREVRSPYPTRYQLDELFEGDPAAARNERLRRIAAAAVTASEVGWPRQAPSSLREGTLAAAHHYHPHLRDLAEALAALPQQGTGNADDPAPALRERIEFVVDRGVVQLELIRPRPMPVAHCAGIVVLDATARFAFEELAAVHPGCPVLLRGLDVSPDPAAQVHRVHIPSQNVTRRSLTTAGLLPPRGRALLVNLLRHVGALAREFLPEGPVSIALITHKPVADALRNDPEWVQQSLPPGLRLDPRHIGHYGRDERGSNRFECADVLITLGDPIPNIASVASQARVLRLAPERVLDRQSRATLLQAHGRLRPLRARTPKLSVHVGRMPPDLRAPWPQRTLPRGRPQSPARMRFDAVVEELLDAHCPVTVQLIEKVLAGCVLYTAACEAIAFLREIEGGDFAECTARTIQTWLGAFAPECGAVRDLARAFGSEVPFWRNSSADAARCREIVVHAHEALRDRPAILRDPVDATPIAAEQSDAAPEVRALLEGIDERIKIIESEHGTTRELAALRWRAQETARYLLTTDAGSKPRGSAGGPSITRTANDGGDA